MRNINSVSETMTLLNEATLMFPNAISFAAGRPPDQFIPTNRVEQWINKFLVYYAQSRNKTIKDVKVLIGQYSETNGIILDLLSRYLAADGPGYFSPENCILTNGAQEAILICLAGLVGQERSVVAPDPTYIGLSGIAESFGYQLETLPDDGNFVDLLEEKLYAQEQEKTVGLVYIIPDFANPSSRVMSLKERHHLLNLADRFNFYVLEDAAYRRFRYEGTQIPTLKEIDDTGRVIYVESFAKTFMPGVRLAIVVADACEHKDRTLVQHLSTIKSYISVTTSPFNQAILGGFLIEQNFQLNHWIETRRQHLKQNRNKLLSALTKTFDDTFDHFQWNTPEGGFFLKLTLPFIFDRQAFFQCARKSKVIVIPISFFSPTGRGTNEIRLSFSNLTVDAIEQGVSRLALHFKCQGI